MIRSRAVLTYTAGVSKQECQVIGMLGRPDDISCTHGEGWELCIYTFSRRWDFGVACCILK
jgi:hypothetical protein